MSGLGRTAWIGVGQLSLSERLFEKRFSELSDRELKTLRRYSRKLSYYKNHAKNVHRQRHYKRDRKVELLETLGLDAACMRCGYDTYIGALEFHHIDPSVKTGLVMEAPLDRLIAEAEKCELICSNCHREKHADALRTGRPRDRDPILDQLIADARALGVAIPHE